MESKAKFNWFEGFFYQMFQKQYPTYNTQKTKGNDSFSKISKYSKLCFAARRIWLV